MSHSVIEALSRMEKKVDRRPRRVLLVDDNPEFRCALRTMLEKMGCECREAICCCDAVRQIQENQFDLCILDLRMPDKDGLTCAKEIEHTAPGLRRVLCTGFPDGLSMEELKDLGFIGLLSKPVTIEDLRKLLLAFNF